MNFLFSLWLKVRFLVFVAGAILAIAMIGFLLSYGWFFYRAQGGFSLNLLKSQLDANQEAILVRNRLREKGFELHDEDVHQLNAPLNSLRYTSDVLSGFEPQKTPDAGIPNSYLFYAKDGTPYYMETKDSEPMPLIHE